MTNSDALQPHGYEQDQRDRQARSYEQDQRDHRQDRREDRSEADVSISAHAARIDALERWQVAQNGSLRRMEDKIDGLKNWMMGSLFTALLAVVGMAVSLLTHKG